jgi:hypothetical protein
MHIFLPVLFIWHHAFTVVFFMQPFARYADDPSLFDDKRDVDRFGDPLLQMKKVRCVLFWQ